VLTCGQAELAHCTYLVDSYMPGTQATDREPHYIKDGENWEKVFCSSFLDASKTGRLGRILWIPTFDIIPPKFRRQWGEYCLLRRRR
jgi:alpha-1,2-mannosyltransferase